MQEKKSVLVAMVKCGKVHRTYGIRLEKNGNNDYVGTWAFPIHGKSKSNLRIKTNQDLA